MNQSPFTVDIHAAIKEIVPLVQARSVRAPALISWVLYAYALQHTLAGRQKLLERAFANRWRTDYWHPGSAVYEHYKRKAG